MRISAGITGLLLCMACASSPSTPANETMSIPAGAPTRTSAPAASVIPPATAASTASATDNGGPRPVGGSATVTLEGETYRLGTGENPICMLTIGVQVGMANEDRTVSLTVHAAGDLNAANFALITPDDRWVPADGGPTFEVDGGRATWNGTLVGQHTNREEDGTIEVVCGGEK